MVIMAKQGSTKDKILKLISEGDSNLSTISEILDLAPSTVSKHLHDLETSGAIVQKYNPHVKKWKYYQLSPEAAVHKTRNERSATATGRNFVKAATSVALLAVFVFAAFIYMQNGASKNVYIPVSITDPPQVPSGTQALYINYSSLSVHLRYNGSSEWVSVNASGRLDLLSLINESQVLGRVKIEPNSTVDMVKFNITSASVTISNITYSVYTLNKQVTAKVDSKAVNASSNILLDFSPVVTPIYSQESTSFVLLPSLQAAVVPNPELTMGPLPARGEQNARYPVQQYKDLFKSGNANLTIENATLHSHGNYTSLSVNLLNSGKSNATIMAVMLYGDEIPNEIPNTTVINGTAIVNASDMRDWQDVGQGFPPMNGNMSAGAVEHAASRMFQRNDSDISINASAIREAGAYLGANSVLIRLPGQSGNILIHDIGGCSAGAPQFFGGTYAINNGMPPMLPPGINFLVNGNGTLFMASPQTMMAPMPKPGYLLLPGSSATLSYNGTIRIMEGGMSITLPIGSSYTVMVVTNEGITRANVTST